jgi:hypothetical protein
MQLERTLGFGREAKVYVASEGTAIKVHDDPNAFQTELLCYLRLMSHDISQVLGHNLPKLSDADEQLLVLEMSIVERPFLLDFGAARLDSAPDFPPEVLETWEQEKIEQFGDNWPHAAAIIDWMRRNMGIYLLDIHPGNIGFK